MKLTAFHIAALIGLGLVARSHAGADNFVDATDLNANPWPAAVSLTTYSVETGEPGHKANHTDGAQKSAWWKWTATENGFCTVDTMGMFDEQHVYATALAVYTGSAVDGLTRVAANDGNGTTLSYASNGGASLSFHAQAGTTYHIAVDGRTVSAVNANNHKVRLRLRFLRAVAEQRIGTFGIPPENCPLLHGMIQLNKTAGHAYSGKLLLNGKSHPLNGVFGNDGYASHSIEQPTAPGAEPKPPLTLLLDGAQNGEFALVSQDYGGAWYGYLRTRQTFANGVASGLAGRYAASVGHKDFDTWRGGALSFTVSKTGQFKGAGILPDGTKITLGSALCLNDANSSWVPIYTSLYKHQGYLYASMKITEDGAVDRVTSEYLSSEHHRPEAPEQTFMPDGASFTFGVDIKGATYTPPAANSRTLGFLDGTAGAGMLSLPMVSGELNPGFAENLTFSTGNAFSFASATRKPALKLNKATGLVTGSVIDDGGLKRKLTGILFLDGVTPKLHGHASGVTENVFFEVVP